MSRIAFLQDFFESAFQRNRSAARLARGGGIAALEAESFETLCDALLSERGEMSGNLIGRALLNRFRAADETEERAFFELLARRYDLNAVHCEGAARRYAEAPSAIHLERLMESTEPRRQELLRRLNRVEGATAELVRMRARSFVHVREDPDLARIDVDFRHLFRSWFNRGFLELRDIDWHTPANILERIIAYEAVHAISSWRALRARLEPTDRRCFGFFHPAMPDEPLIFVEVALTRGAPASVRELLGDERERIDAADADTAVFYSISNCQKGLAGISFGNFLIKHVAAELKTQLPNLEIFRTLSPVPSLMRWVDERAAGTAGEGAPPANRPDAAMDAVPTGANDAAPDSPGALALARGVARGESAALDADSSRTLARLAAHYLVEVTRDDGQPRDPVARFHLGNGASLDRVLPEADRFERGLGASAGVMVSYLYDLESVERNHERYADRREVTASREVRELITPTSWRMRRA